MTLLFAITPVLFALTLALFFYAVIRTRNIPVLSIPVGVALVAPFFWGMAVDYSTSRDRSVGAIFIPLLLFLLFILALLGVYVFICGIRRLKPRLRAVVMIALPVSLFAVSGMKFFAWSNGNIGHVISSAQNIAGEQPYCVDVATDGRYKAATSNADFSGYRMRAAHGWGWYAGPHAILAVGNGVEPEIYHWSYNRRTFIKDSDNRSLVYCAARKHFAETLEEPEVEQPYSTFRYAGMNFSIPTAYWSGVFDFGSHPKLVFEALAPDFESIPEGTKTYNSFTEVEFAENGRTDTWLLKDRQSEFIEDNGEAFGLRKRTLWDKRPEYREKWGASAIEYYATSDDQSVVTLIHCGGGDKGICTHLFRNGGWSYYFHHAPKDISDWKNMQEKLVSLTHSFIRKP